jgi:hypothetical protein
MPSEAFRRRRLVGHLQSCSERHGGRSLQPFPKEFPYARLASIVPVSGLLAVA